MLNYNSTVVNLILNGQTSEPHSFKSKQDKGSSIIFIIQYCVGGPGKFNKPRTRNEV